jgi:hypothetical protein
MKKGSALFNGRPGKDGDSSSIETDVSIREFWKQTRREMLSLEGMTAGLLVYPYVLGPHMVVHWLKGVDPFSGQGAVALGAACAIVYPAMCVAGVIEKRWNGTLPSP